MTDIETQVDWLPDGVAVLTPVGTLNRATYRTLRNQVVKAAVDEPRAVLVDVAGLEVPASPALTLFPALAQELANWPGLPLLLIDSTAGVLDAYHMSRYVPVYRNLPDALAGISVPPPRQVATRELPNTLGSARVGREFVWMCCRRWKVDEPRTEDAVVIADELVENTLVHTFYPAAIRMDLRRDVLTVAVSDPDPTQPPPLPPDSPVHGLTLVRKLSRAWGIAPTADGGKVVWAAL